MKLLRLGDQGSAVAEVRATLTYLGFLPATPRQGGEPGDSPAGPSAEEQTPDRFDRDLDLALRAFQQSRGLSVDGILGPDTARALEEARHNLGDRLLYLSATHPFVGDDVAALQERLFNMGFDVGRTDGIFGPRTESAVRDFQRNRGLEPDGRCGPRTLRELKRLRRTVTGGRPDVLRESVRILARGTSLLGVVVALDPGHGGDDPGIVSNGLCERDLMADLAARLSDRLIDSGLESQLIHGPEESPTEAERAARANAMEADILISLHADGSSSQHAQGVSAYYYGNARGSSAMGERFAQLVQREIVSRTDMQDCRTHPKVWDLLRRTRMPAVRLDLGYLTNHHDARALGSTEFRAAVAEAVLAATQRLFLPPEMDAPTGQLHVPRVAGRT
ncbi:N-acetylmuramoyl-L-alanine amidase CwlM [Frankia canadensis]|uniref:N-acetylmuramoyl-L-alanine amidase CwlM n=1 Tax=Frankia canadensis TaxID=1836972 RepID=A0A2I2L0H6_9ACTN|nr:N-acetylmuramoyl-L-alanine amidase [Frankia canadensis]SNQ51433.1 N-acetylmuramoyl-L-alanine amidase CwlM [Frankia canadensis]SOU58723.1 N-acetylmuramoyl-L-alanine amidase CwlM [Frankia canadensis]